MFGLTSITQLYSLFGVANTMRSLISQALSGASLADMAKQVLSGDLVSVLEKQAESLLPNVAPELRLAAAIVTGYDNDRTKWLQQALNTILEINIEVDGIYGPATVAAVEQFQTQHLGLKIDGFAYRVTHAAIQATMARIFGTTQPKITQEPVLAPAQVVS